MKQFWANASFDDRLQLIILTLLRLSIVVAAGVAVVLGQWELLFFSVIALLLSYTPLLIERNYRIDLPVEYEVIIVLFVYAAMFLGEAENFYQRFWWWDLFLHGLAGALLAFTGFMVLYTLYVRKKLVAKPFVISVFVFSFSLAIGALWEIFEFAVDEIFGTNMQKSGLPDTMTDLIVDSGGALIAAGLGYFYLKRRNHTGIFGRFVANFLNNNPHLDGRTRGRR